MRCLISKRALVLLHGKRHHPNMRMVFSWEEIETQTRVEIVDGKRRRVVSVLGFLAESDPPSGWSPPPGDGLCYICMQKTPEWGETVSLNVEELFHDLRRRRGIVFTEEAYRYLLERYERYPLRMDEEIDLLDDICLEGDALPLDREKVSEILPSWERGGTSYLGIGGLKAALNKPLSPELDREWGGLAYIPVRRDWEMLRGHEMIGLIRAIAQSRRGVPLRFAGAFSEKESDRDHRTP